MSNFNDLEYQEFWNERYKNQQFAYGTKPNAFFKNCINQLTPKNILLPADGEGRNGVYVANLGWKVVSIDLSEEGKNKALQLAKEKNTSLEYIVGDIGQCDFPKESFDCIGLIYAHFSPDKIATIHQKLNDSLKPKGSIIFEAYSKTHLPFKENNPKIGGPQSLDMLFSVKEIKRDFPNFDFKILEDVKVQLNEGNFHNGIGKVIRGFGTKK
ncbi:class I SAM-dependent methyltransferase [Aquimarina longa]|uniref:class I SAM-dependent methyltransferase n=1 Tax=Aquimarina longa TaxID=1080221 RepID=UPI00078031D5|nr:class I SAM-dependent methyltransferase [Aquimarina longa]